ncbi:caspase domain-containing protein [Kordia periserrulae]|uniref:Caspase domain-containing protein n=1 Tax=Kordia periserrulae TaxID=701523 RepID=A0A2T6BYJ0_9FLAO|nr:caspase family protein [Kordia periserrulae]PTX61096.1 caspase domain-containing protein [Kordia periserrulae]
MPRKALIVGINHYNHASKLDGCINDAKSVKNVLQFHGTHQRERNFHIDLKTSDQEQITSGGLQDALSSFFQSRREISLFYFSGHGYVRNGQGYLLTPECKRGDQGVPMKDILRMANDSPASNRIIILDCCHAGIFDNDFLGGNLTRIAEGVTVLAAATKKQYAIEMEGEGVFTKLFCNAMEGGAASIIGEITPGSVYGYIDKAMGQSGQRPVFTTKIQSYACLRKIASQINVVQLRKIIELFEHPDMDFKLDRTYEYTNTEEAISEHVEKFKILQLYNRVNLVIPVNAPHMYDAAQNEESCRLTEYGKSYWTLVKSEVI